jgi:hypothetical protein
MSGRHFLPARAAPPALSHAQPLKRRPPRADAAGATRDGPAPWHGTGFRQISTDFCRVSAGHAGLAPVS